MHLSPERVERGKLQSWGVLGLVVKRWRSRDRQALLARGLGHVTLIVLGTLFAIPLAWMIGTSLKSDQQIFTWPPVWIPSPVVWANYPRAISYIPFWLYLKNTLYIVLLMVIGTLLSCSPAAYGFSRIRWPGRDVVFVVLLATLMIPGPVTLIPTFILFRTLGWYGTFKPLVIPPFFGSAFGVFLLRQFFMTIPQELSDAARIDG